MKSITFLAAPLAAIALVSCASTGRGPAGLTAANAATDARAFAVIAEEISAELGESDPELAEKVDGFATNLLDLGALLDDVQGGAGAADDLQARIHLAIGAGAAILETLDPEQAERWQPYVRSVRIMLRLAEVYSSELVTPRIP